MREEDAASQCKDTSGLLACNWSSPELNMTNWPVHHFLLFILPPPKKTNQKKKTLARKNKKITIDPPGLMAIQEHFNYIT